jgi:C4-dicarboxylate-binding protein DctP
MTVSDHGYLGYLVVMSKKFWDSLPDDLKANVKQAMKEATAEERKLAVELDKSQFAQIEKYAKDTKKLEITVLTAEQRAAWQKVMGTIYPKFYDNAVIGKDLIVAAQKAGE